MPKGARGGYQPTLEALIGGYEHAYCGGGIDRLGGGIAAARRPIGEVCLRNLDAQAMQRISAICHVVHKGRTTQQHTVCKGSSCLRK